MNSTNPTVASNVGRECWLPTLQLAVKEVFELMLACTLQIPDEIPDTQGLDITSMVGLAGQLCGILTVRCSAKSAARMASRMLGVDVDKAGPEMWDAVGEICNMVAGNFKNKISGLGDGCMLSVPTVITGADYSLHSMVNGGNSNHHAVRRRAAGAFPGSSQLVGFGLLPHRPEDFAGCRKVVRQDLPLEIFSLWILALLAVARFSLSENFQSLICLGNANASGTVGAKSWTAVTMQPVQGSRRRPKLSI